MKFKAWWLLANLLPWWFQYTHTAPFGGAHLTTDTEVGDVVLFLRGDLYLLTFRRKGWGELVHSEQFLVEIIRHSNDNTREADDEIVLLCARGGWWFARRVSE